MQDAASQARPQNGVLALYYFDRPALIGAYSQQPRATGPAKVRVELSAYGDAPAFRVTLRTESMEAAREAALTAVREGTSNDGFESQGFLEFSHPSADPKARETFGIVA